MPKGLLKEAKVLAKALSLSGNQSAASLVGTSKAETEKLENKWPKVIMIILAFGLPEGIPASEPFDCVVPTMDPYGLKIGIRASRSRHLDLGISVRASGHLGPGISV